MHTHKILLLDKFSMMLVRLPLLFCYSSTSHTRKHEHYIQRFIPHTCGFDRYQKFTVSGKLFRTPSNSCNVNKYWSWLKQELFLVYFFIFTYENVEFRMVSEPSPKNVCTNVMSSDFFIHSGFSFNVGA